MYLEGETSGTFLEKKETIEAYRNVLRKLDEIALSEDQSREVIGSVAVTRYASQEGHDDLAQEQLQQRGNGLC